MKVRPQKQKTKDYRKGLEQKGKNTKDKDKNNKKSKKVV